MTVRWTTAFLDFPASTFAAGCLFWQGVTGYGLSPRRGVRGEFATLEPDDGDAYLRVQRVDSDGPGCHIDLHVDDVEGTAVRASALGGAVKEARPGFCVLASPAGLPFCLVAAHTGQGSERPPPKAWPGGHQSLVDQVCIDVAPGSYSDEATFWAALTGWERCPGSRREFEYLLRPTGIPLRFLLQRLDDGAEQGRCRAHLDLACNDMKAERLRHVALGAAMMAQPAWTTLRDPTGLSYCVTRRHPATGTLAPQ